MKGLLLKLLFCCFILALVTLPFTFAFSADNVFTDNVGVGKTSPSARLDIRASGTTTGFALRIADSLGTDRLTILDTGNIGIGTTAPSEKLTLAGGNILQTALNSKVISSIDDVVNFYLAKTIVVSGKYAYIADYSSGAGTKNFVSVDISNPVSPVVVGSIDDDVNLYRATGLYISGKYAYLTNLTSAANIPDFVIIDISNPASPFITGAIDDNTSFNGADAVYVSGKYAYVVNLGATVGARAFAVVDISNPFSPTVIGGINNEPLLNTLTSIAVSGKYAYVTLFTVGPTNNNLSVVDISNPASPFIVGGVNDETNLYGARNVSVSGKYAYVTNAHTSAGVNNFAIVDISNPLSPYIAGALNDDNALYYAFNLYVSGKYAYVVNYNDGSGGKKNFTVIDISKPSSPVIVDSISDGIRLGYGRGIFVSGKYAYMANYDNASSYSNFTVVDISGIDSPSASIGAIQTGSLQVTENADIKNNLSVGTGLNVGQGGIYSAGPIALASAHTGAASILDIWKPSSSASSPILQVMATGNVGIGKTTPSSALDIAGRIKATEFQLGTSTTNGYVLTADTSGVGTWAAAGAGSSGWTDDGTTVRLSATTDNVGIGTSSPSAKMQVTGGSSSGDYTVKLYSGIDLGSWGRKK